jgi:hypothetical protein
VVTHSQLAEVSRRKVRVSASCEATATPSVLAAHESALVEARLQHDGIAIHRNVEVGRVIGVRRNRVVGVETRTTSS